MYSQKQNIHDYKLCDALQLGFVFFPCKFFYESDLFNILLSLILFSAILSFEYFKIYVTYLVIL